MHCTVLPVLFWRNFFLLQGFIVAHAVYTFNPLFFYVVISQVFSLTWLIFRTFHDFFCHCSQLTEFFSFTGLQDFKPLLFRLRLLAAVVCWRWLVWPTWLGCTLAEISKFCPKTMRHFGLQKSSKNLFQMYQISVQILVFVISNQ